MFVMWKSCRLPKKTTICSSSLSTFLSNVNHLSFYDVMCLDLLLGDRLHSVSTNVSKVFPNCVKICLLIIILLCCIQERLDQQCDHRHPQTHETWKLCPEHDRLHYSCTCSRRTLRCLLLWWNRWLYSQEIVSFTSVQSKDDTQISQVSCEFASYRPVVICHLVTSTSCFPICQLGPRRTVRKKFVP